MKRLIFIYGPPTSGKTTTGKLFADQIGLPFIDIDDVIESRYQKTITEIFETLGEQGFRRIEKDTILGIIAQQEGVIALGGGALLDPDLCEYIKKAGQVICLRASLESLKSRLAEQNNGQRPLLTGDQVHNLENLLALRKDHYASFATWVNTDGKNPREIANALQIESGNFHLNLMPSESDILVRRGIIDSIGSYFGSFVLQKQKIILVTDHNVEPIYSQRVIESIEAEGFSTGKIAIPPGEQHKSLDSLTYLWDKFLEKGLDRQGLVVALGGGVVSDLTGFAAATFMRGVPWAVIPTTLLSMVDASLGGKTGIDLRSGKNLVGAFHSPNFVFVDPDTIKTLPDVEIRNGMAEVIKHGVIADPALFEYSASGIPTSDAGWDRLIKQAIAVKVGIVQIDPFEKGRRAELNFGHTIGHGLEVLSGYQLRHGEAVSIGMVVEAGLAERMAICPPDTCNQIRKVLSAIQLPTCIPDSTDLDALLKLIQVDKKRVGGVVRFSLPQKIGKMKTGIEIKSIREMLSTL